MIIEGYEASKKVVEPNMSTVVLMVSLMMETDFSHQTYGNPHINNHKNFPNSLFTLSIYSESNERTILKYQDSFLMKYWCFLVETVCRKKREA